LDSTKKQELIYFEQLKHTLRKEVESSLHIRKEFKEWSGSDIQTFQIDLEEKCKSTVSEKWVYLHFKNPSEKLPRVDVLNLLSQYCGFKNWDDFKRQKEVVPAKAEEKKRSKKFGLLGVLAGALSLAVIFLMPTKKTTVYFVDAYTQKPIALSELSYNLDVNKFAQASTENEGKAVVIKLQKDDTLKVDGPYYKPVDFYLDQEHAPESITIKVFPDDYAMMLNYFSRSEEQNWQKRKAQLEGAIHNDAVIFQSHPQHDGIEMLNKGEFIDRLILPVNSLKNLEIQDIVYKDGQILNLRFVQKDK
jgi:hypothetical protein